MDIDCVIPVHDKDLPKLKYCVSGIRRHVTGVRDIWIVGHPRHQRTIEALGSPVRFEDEGRFARDFDLPEPPEQGWFFQQLIKLAMSRRVSTSHYLVVDADTIFLRPTTFVDGHARPMHFVDVERSGRDCATYVRTIQELLGFTPAHRHCYITHHMLFNGGIVAEMLDRFAVQPWWAIRSKFSEYDTYGSYVERYFPADMKPRVCLWRNMHWRWWNDEECTTDMLRRMAARGVTFVSFHHWVLQLLPTVTRDDIIDYVQRCEKTDLLNWLIRARPDKSGRVRQMMERQLQ